MIKVCKKCKKNFNTILYLSVNNRIRCDKRAFCWACKPYGFKRGDGVNHNIGDILICSRCAKQFIYNGAKKLFCENCL